MAELAPVPPRERVLALDVLRGFALCGVLIGNMVLYSGRWAERGPAPDPPVLDQIAAAATTVGVVKRLGVLPLPEYGMWGRAASAVTQQLGYLSLALAYAAVTVLLLQRPAWRRALGVLAPAGRMPLTTYVSQSLICTFLFYGWGLGWAGLVGPAGCLGLALAIFGVQIAIAHLWLRRFRFGPLEWVWRSVAYLKPQPMWRS